MKPSTAILHKERDFYIPDFSKNIHYEGEIVLKIGKNGKAIDPKFASNYISQITVGIDFTARDLQDELKKKGHPWEIAKSFDGSAVLGEWKEASAFDFRNISFQLYKNDACVQDGNTSLLLFPFEQLIAHISRYFTLQTGDVIFTGTPAGVAQVSPGDHLAGYLAGEKVMECRIK